MIVWRYCVRQNFQFNKLSSNLFSISMRSKKNVAKSLTKKGAVRKKGPGVTKSARRPADKARAASVKKIKKPIGEATDDNVKNIESADKIKDKTKYSLLRGMHDILPREERYWEAFRQMARNLAKHFQFKRIETPILEEASLFIRSIGKGTDVVDKEMYIFEDRDKHKVCLRPEMTASVVRAYITHGLWNMPQPVKLWYWGPMFRHDRPQAGRYRQFYQVGFETFGEDNPIVDAELILLAYNFYNDLGLPVEARVNSIGTPRERERYKTALLEYYRGKRSYLCEECLKRINRNPLRLLDCKQEQCRPVKEDAPQIVEWLEPGSKNHFMAVLEYLDELGVPYVLDHSLVRGLDYYTRTVFEIYPTATAETKAQSALGGGGRYDLLSEQMGGRPTPAGGFSLGIERSVTYLKQCCEQEICKLAKEKFDVFIAQLGEQARKRGLKIIDDLKDSGLAIDFNLSKQSLKGQLDIANGLQVPFALILGQKEVQDSTVIIRDMESGVQEIVEQKKVIGVLKKKLGRFDQNKKK